MDDALPPVKTRSPLLRIAVVLLLLIAAVAGYLHYNASQQVGKVQVNDNLAVLDVRLENLDRSISLHEKRIAALEETAKTPAPATANGKDEERITALEKEIAALKSAPPANAGTATMGGEQTFHAIRMLSAFNRLSDKIIGGKPFAAELSAFEEQDSDVASSKPVTTLAPYADSGVPSYATLLSSFDESLDQLNILEATPPVGAGIWDRFVFNLKHLINIRRITSATTENSVDAIVARAEAHLENEEIEAAIAELKSLPDTARSSFAGWIEDAQLSTQAPALLDAAEEQVMQKAFHTEPPAPASPPAVQPGTKG